MQPKPYFWHRLRLLFVGFVSLTLLAACSDAGGRGAVTSESAAEPAPEVQIKTVRTEPIMVHEFGEPVAVEGTVRPMEVYWVTAKQGGDVTEIVKERGDIVTEGEVIVRLTSEELRKDRARAVSALQAAQRRVADARKDAAELEALNRKNLELAMVAWNRARNDFELGLIDESEYHRAQVEIERTRSEAERLLRQQNAVIVSYQQEADKASQQVREWDDALEALHVRSTVSGVVSDIPITPGMRLGFGAQAALIEKVDRVRIEAPIPEELLRFVQGKELFTIQASGSGKEWKAAFVSLAEALNDDTGAYSLVLEADNPEMALSSGMKIKVYLTDENQLSAIAVPTKAILSDEGEPYVFVAKGDRVEKRKLVTGRIHNGYQEVLSGVSENEQLVVTGIGSLHDQEQVQVQEQKVEKQ